MKFENSTIQVYDDSKSGKVPPQIFEFNAKKIKEVQEYGGGIFFAINPQEVPNERGIENTKEFKRLGLDLDVAKEKQHLTKEEISTKKSELIQKLKTLKIPPNYIILTKNGVQPVWIWQNPISLKNLEDRNKANTYYRRIVAGFGEVTGLISEGDNISRVLRFPHTLHLKTPDDPFKITIEKVNPDDTIDFEKFISTYPPVAEKEYNANITNNLSEIVKGLSEGDRNIGATSIAGSLLARYNPQDWESIVWPLFEAWNEKRNNPPLSLSELTSVFKSIAGKELRKEAGNAYETLPIPIEDGRGLTSVNYDPIPLSEISSVHSRVEWVWEGYCAKGELTLCSALPKVGKSTIIAYLLKCLQTGESFAGQEVQKSKTLIISEESKALWARKRDDLELEGEIWIIPQPYTEKPSYRQWIDLLESSTKFCKENEIDLVVIDTITSFWHVKDEGNAPEVQAALLPLNHLTKAGIAVLIVHHHRKSGGDEGVASRGSTAFGSAVSILLEVSRKERDNPHNSQRVLKTYSRFEESPLEIVIELQDDKYITLGTSLEVSRQARLDKVLSILPVEPKGITAQEILDLWEVEELGKKPSRSSINRYLADLLDNAQIKIVGEKEIKRTKAPLYGKVKQINNATQTTPLSLKDEERSEAGIQNTSDIADGIRQRQKQRLDDDGRPLPEGEILK